MFYLCFFFFFHALFSLLFYIFTVLFSSQTGNTVALMLFSIATIVAEENGAFFKIKENYFLSDKNKIWVGTTSSLLSCSQRCARQTACKSANFLVNTKTCLLLGENQKSLPNALVRQEDSFYTEKVCSYVRKKRIFLSCFLVLRKQ